ncbi:hypothetical protein LEN26_014541 [Aphanomyces euteiches]|nr:hypothetical protein LEN26_014541 [Aphanomyces euteiches]KAH9108484.1 hypothetical protein AeMF1_016353 [Aphanomyces euteiches]KAH9187208.1 hypothetical protein AeNC1_010815 [Aphanomyces euteiches]
MRAILAAVLFLHSLSTSNLYFEVPFHLHEYAMTAELVNSSIVHLCVQHVINSTCSQTAPSADSFALSFDVAPSDRLVAVDSYPITLTTFEQVAEAPTGTSFVLPLFDSPDDDDDDATQSYERILSGFAKFDIMAPEWITFEPTKRQEQVYKNHSTSPYSNFDEDPNKLQFKIAFHTLVDRDCRVEAVYVAGAGVQLRVLSIDAVPASQKTELDIAAADRLIAVDGRPIQLQSLDAILDNEPGIIAMLTLVESSNETVSNRLRGFLTAEILSPSMLTFEITTERRQTEFKQVYEVTSNKSSSQKMFESTSFPVVSTLESTAMIDGNLSGEESRKTRDVHTAKLFVDLKKTEVMHFPTVEDDAPDSTCTASDLPSNSQASYEQSNSSKDDDSIVNTSTEGAAEGNLYPSSAESTTTNDVYTKSVNFTKEEITYFPTTKDEVNSSYTASNSPSISPSTLEPSHSSSKDPDSVADNATALPLHPQDRKRGGFAYDVVFKTKTRLGIDWNPNLSDQTVVESVDSHSPAAATGLIEPNDQLIAINGVNVTLLGPHDVLPIFMASTWPKTLRFWVAIVEVNPPPPPTITTPEIPKFNESVPPPLHSFPLASYSDIPRLRENGVAFWYEVVFPEMSNPVGIYWDLATTERTIVHALEPESPAAKLQVIAPGDHLILINGIDVATLAPREALVHYKSAPAPRTLVLYCIEKTIEIEAAQVVIAEETTPPQTHNVSQTSQDQLDHESARTQEWQLVSHDTVRESRLRGLRVNYEVIVPEPGPIGIIWNRNEKSATVVDKVESICRFSVVKPMDQLIAINEKNTSTIGPSKIASVYSQTGFPKRLIFRTGVDANPSNETEESFEYVLMINFAPWSKPLVAPTTEFTLVAADPPSGCMPIDAGNEPHVMFVALRGVCPFTEKAQYVEHAGRGGLLLVNNVAGPGVFPSKMPNVAKVDIPVAMLAKDEGDVLLGVLQHEQGAGTWMRVNNEEKINHLSRDELKNVDGEMVLWHAIPTPTITKFTYIPGMLGHHVRQRHPYRMVLSTPFRTACHRDDLQVRGKGSVVVVQQGSCSFAQKAKVVEQLGAQGMIVVGVDDSPIQMDDGGETNIRLWAVMLGRSDGERLDQILKASSDAPVYIRFEPHAADISNLS